MTTTLKATLSRSLLLGLLLGVGCSTAIARDARMHGPNGDGGSCPDAAMAAPTVSATTAKTVVAPVPNHSDKIKPVIGVRGGGDDAGSHAPRWHSFLPGMFR